MGYMQTALGSSRRHSLGSSRSRPPPRSSNSQATDIADQLTSPGGSVGFVEGRGSVENSNNKNTFV